MTNLEGRVILREQAVAPPDGVRTDLDVMAGLAERLGSPVAFSTDPEEVFAELGRASAGRPRRLRRHQLRRGSAPSTASSGRARPPTTRAPRGCSPTASPTADGRARFVAVDHRGPAEQPCADYPLHLTTGRVLAQYQSGAQTRRIADLPDDGPVRRAAPDAGRPDRRRTTASRSSSTTRRGEMKAPARVVDHDPPGHGLRAVPLGRRQPAHQRRARPVEPDAGVQGLRRGGADMSAAAHRRGRAAAWPRPGSSRSWSAARRRATDVTVLGDEPHAPYNRILLSAVLEGTHRPSALTLREPAGTPSTASTCASAPACSRSTATRREVDARRRHAAAATTGWCSPPAPSRRCRRSAGWSGRTAGCTTGGARLPQPRRLPPARRPRCPDARARGRRRRRPARSPGRPRARASAASRPRSSRAATTCCAARSAPRPARCCRATWPGSAPTVYTGARAVRLDRRAACVLDNGFTLDDRPRGAHRRRPPGDRAGPRRRARPSPRHRRRRPAAHRRRPDVHAIGDCAQHARPGHGLRAAGLGAGRRARRVLAGERRRPYDGRPQRRPAARHRPRRRRARRPRAAPTARSSRWPTRSRHATASSSCATACIVGGHPRRRPVPDRPDHPGLRPRHRPRPRTSPAPC